MDIVVQNLLSPAVLFFVLGIIAALCKSDLKFPSGLSEGLSLYLLIAIGLKGGIALSKYSIEDVLLPVTGALFLGVLIPLLMLFAARRLGLDRYNAIGLAAAYGSVSIVTYGAALSFLEKSGAAYEGFMNALVVLMESPAIFVSLLLLNMLEKQRTLAPAAGMGIVSGGGRWVDPEVLRESIFGKSVFLLLGSLLIGLIVGERGLAAIKPVFMDLYSGVLLLFLLNMGLVTGQRLPEVKQHGLKLIVLGIAGPLVFGCIGVLTGYMTGLSHGGMTLLGVLAGSASYIAAPAALKTSVPQASPSIYLGLALGVTFPFNLIAGIPLYHALANMFS